MKTIVPFKPSTQDDDPTLIQTDEDRSRLLQEISDCDSEDPAGESDKVGRGKHFWKDIFG